MTFGKFIATLAIAGAVAGGGYIFVEKKNAAAVQAERMDAAKPTAAPAITVSKVTTNDFVETAVVSGSLIPREEILVSPEIEGLRVLELLADEGDHVKKGEVLARLVSEQIDAQIAQNQANIARSVAAIAQAQSQIAQAEAQAKEAAAQLERAEPLKKVRISVGRHLRSARERRAHDRCPARRRARRTDRRPSRQGAGRSSRPRAAVAAKQYGSDRAPGWRHQPAERAHGRARVIRRRTDVPHHSKR